MTKAQAEALTERIRAGITETWRLLAEASEGRAWEPMGYDSFGDYVAAEFDLSRGQGYRLLDQARIILELEAASDADLSGVISGRAASDLSPVLDEAVAAVARARQTDEADRPAVVAEVLAPIRKRARKAKTVARARQPEPIEAVAVAVPPKHLDGTEPEPIPEAPAVTPSKITGVTAEKPRTSQQALKLWLATIAVTSVEELKAVGFAIVRDAVDRLAAADGRQLLTSDEVEAHRKTARELADLKASTQRPGSLARIRSAAPAPRSDATVVCQHPLAKRIQNKDSGTIRCGVCGAIKVAGNWRAALKN